MSKLTRYAAKVFGSTASANQIAEYGSLAAATPARYSGSTITPAIVQSLSNYLTGWFGAVIGGASPAIEDLNALDYLWSYQIAYLMQEGIAEYDASTNYFIGSIVQSGGLLYMSSIDNNVGNTPASNLSDWNSTFVSNGNIVNGTITGAKIGSKTVAVTNIVAPGQQISTSCGSFTTTAVLSPTQVTNLSATITTTGNPVMVFCQSDGTVGASGLPGGVLLTLTSAGPGTGFVSITRGATTLAQMPYAGVAGTGGGTAGGFPGTTISFLDTPAAGTYTYSVKAYVGASGTTMGVADLVLVAYEIK